MAKIIVTQHGSPFNNLVRKIIETDEWVISESKLYQGKTRLDNDKGGYYIIVEESPEEVLTLIHEAEAQATNKKLDEILENQRKILEKLSDMDREVVSCEEF
ncbi:MAG: hypothetical protein E7314_07855 [Clostridiales bacterium]|nr:hypothetical protein [Clostridiales bacterium]